MADDKGYTFRPGEEELFNALLESPQAPPPANDAAAVTDDTPEGRRAAIAATSQDPELMGLPKDPTQAADMMATPMAQTAGVSALAGIAKAFFEVKDTVVGEPNQEDKWAIRDSIERDQAKREQLPGAAGVVNGLSRNIAEFTTAFVGVGKVLPFLKYGKGVIGFGLNSSRAAAVGATAFDPHEERLSNLVERFPSLSNPITRYLAADIKDAKADGRIKAALESFGVDGMVAGAFILGAKAMKLRRVGDQAGAVKAETQANNILSSEAAKKFFVNSEGDVMTDLATQDFKVAAQAKTAQSQAELDAFNERAATLEHEAGLPRVEAEAQARQELGIEFPGDAPTPPPQGSLPLEGAAPRVGREDARSRPLSEADAGPEGGLDPPWTPGGNAPGGDGGAPRGPAMAADSGVRDPSISGPVGGTEAVPGRPPRAAANTIELPEIVVTPENLERMRKDNAAIEKAGSLQDAIEDGHRFGGRGSLPWQKFNGPDEAAAWMGQTIEDNAATIEKARGGAKVGSDGARVMTDRQVDSLVDQWVRVFGEDPGLVMGTLQRAGKDAKTLAAKMETAFLIANRANQDNYELALKVSLGNYDRYGSKDAAMAQLAHQMSIAVEMTASARAILASAGRTVRRARGEFKARADAMAQIDIKNMDPDALVQAVLSTKGDPALMNKLGQPNVFNLAVDYAGAMQAANLLWGWKTHVVNFVGNVAMTMWRPLEKGVGATVMRAIPKLSANAKIMQTEARREVLALASTTRDGWEAAVQAFLTGDSRLTPHNIEALADATGQGRMGTGNIVTQWRPITSMEDVAYNAMLAATTGTSLPLRAMGASDEMIRTMRYRAIVMAKAATDADELGLKGDVFKAYIQKRVEDSFDAEGRAIDAKAAAEAKATVFSQDLIQRGTQDTYGGAISVGAWVQNSAAQIPLMRLIVPFIRTPTNLFRYGVKLTPGLNLLQREYQNAIRGLKGPEEQARAIGQMMLGTLLMSQALYLKASGQLTGSGPVSPKALKEWKAEGNTPYSYTWTDKAGNKQSFQFNRLDPIQFPFAAAADFAEMLEMSKARAAAGTQLGDDEMGWAQAIMLAVAHQFRDKTYTKNVANFLEFIGDPEGRAQIGYNMATGLIPAVTLFRGVNPDEYLRETHSFLDTAKAALPGYSEELPPRYDAYGEKVKVPGGFLNEGTIKGPLGDALQESYAETGGNVIQPMVPRDSATNVDYRDLILEDGRTAFETLQALSAKPTKGIPPMKEALTRLVSSKPYKMAPHGRTEAQGTKEYMLTKVISDYRRAAKAELQRTSKLFREKAGAEVRRNWEATVSNYKDAKVEGSKAGLATMSPLLDAYGLGGVLNPAPPQGN